MPDTNTIDTEIVIAQRFDGLPMKYDSIAAARADAKRLLADWMQKGDRVRFIASEDGDNFKEIGVVFNECGEETDACVYFKHPERSPAYTYKRGKAAYPGDNVIGIETGWIGKVIKVYNKPYQVESGGPKLACWMLECKCVNIATDEVEDDDTRDYASQDVRIIS